MSKYCDRVFGSVNVTSVFLWFCFLPSARCRGYEKLTYKLTRFLLDGMFLHADYDAWLIETTGKGQRQSKSPVVLPEVRKAM